MMTIEERADKYVDAPCEKNCSECSMLEASCRFYNDRLSFIAGSKSEHEELTRWNSPDEHPVLEKRVLVKVQNEFTGKIDYSVGRYFHYGWDAIGISFDYKIIGWREIHE